MLIFLPSFSGRRSAFFFFGLAFFAEPFFAPERRVIRRYRGSEGGVNGTGTGGRTLRVQNKLGEKSKKIS